MKKLAGVGMWLLLATLISQASGIQSALPPNSPIARNQRPRIWITQQNIPAIREKMLGDLRPWTEFLAKLLDTDIATPSLNRFKIVHSYAFAYVMLKHAGPLPMFKHPADTYGRLAHDMAMESVALAEATGDARMGALLDWLWDLYTPQERVTFANWLKSQDGKIDSGSPCVSQFVDVRAGKLAGAIALKGSGIDENWADTRLAQYREWFREPEHGYTKTESDMGAGVDAGYCATWSYGIVSAKYGLFAEEAYRTAFGISEADHYGVQSADNFRLQAPHILHRLFPNPNRAEIERGAPFVPEGGHNGMQGIPTGPGAAAGEALLPIVGIYDDLDPTAAGLTQWTIDNVYGMPSMNQNTFLFGNPIFNIFIRGAGRRVAALSPEQAGQPLTVFNPQMGRLLWKTSWGAMRSFPNGSSIWTMDDDAQVVIDAERWGSHGRMGTFQLYRKGPMIVHQGGGLSGHDQIACNGAMSGNVLLFPLPKGRDCGGNRGGGLGQLGSAGFVPLSDADHVERFDQDVQRTYRTAFLDITRAYPNTRTPSPSPKVSQVTRQFVELTPQRASDPTILVIVDRATVTSSQVDPRWLIHPSAEPKLMPDGTLTWVNDQFGAAGRGFITPVQPVGRTVKIWDGHNTPYAEQGDTSAWDAPSLILPRPISASYPGQAPWLGRWTIDIRPSVRNISNVFVTVVEATDLNKSKTPVTAIGQSGVQVGTRMVVCTPTSCMVK